MSEFLNRSDNLTRSIVELKANPFSPETNTNYWRTKLQEDGKRIGFLVPDCDWTEEEIKKPILDVNEKEVPPMMIYLPEQLTGGKGIVRLGKMLPDIDSWIFEGYTDLQEDILESNKNGEWVKVEAVIRAPNRNASQVDLKNHAQAKKYFPQRLGVFILASEKSKDLTGHYLDERMADGELFFTLSRLPGSRIDNHVVCVYFEPSGLLHVGLDLVHPQRYSEFKGGRFEQAKKA